ncbi:homeodomain-interacting protein kinase 3-like [Scomber scombrus]|uniref:Homeodomain-interacting protein kinase 3-like n=1 Tax=Scomber scombrus TaxID=13677 RepID=A0AAV1QG52_SCOSC
MCFTFELKMTSDKETPSTRTKSDFKIEVHDILPSFSGKYEIEKFLGEGRYGKVAQCLKLGSKEKIAIKIVRKKYTHNGKKEVHMLRQLIGLDLNKHNLVTFIEHFRYRGHICLAFEMLDISLWDLMKERTFKPMNLSEIRVIAQQLLVALEALKRIGLVHGDIKMDNVMLVNHKSQSLKLKLIDFGLAKNVSMLRRGTVMQALGYRAPEVILGLPLREAIDMWGVGCVVAFLYLGTHVYSTQCEYEVLRAIVQVQSQPEDRMLTPGMFTPVFFKKIQDKPPSWRLKTKTEYETTTGTCTIPFNVVGLRRYMLFSLDGMTRFCGGMRDHAEFEDKAAFVSIMKQMLHVDYKKRITPEEALGHRFITLRHFKHDTNSPYVTSANVTIEKCSLEMSSAEYMPFVTPSEPMSLKFVSIPSSDDTSSPDESMGSLDETCAHPTNRPKAAVRRPAANNRPPANNAPTHVHKAASPSSVKRNLPRATSKEDSSGLVEVKCGKTFFKRVGRFFSRMREYPTFMKTSWRHHTAG